MHVCMGRVDAFIRGIARDSNLPFHSNWPKVRCLTSLGVPHHIDTAGNQGSNSASVQARTRFRLKNAFLSGVVSDHPAINNPAAARLTGFDAARGTAMLL